MTGLQVMLSQLEAQREELWDRKAKTDTEILTLNQLILTLRIRQKFPTAKIVEFSAHGNLENAHFYMTTSLDAIYDAEGNLVDEDDDGDFGMSFIDCTDADLIDCEICFYDLDTWEPVTRGAS